MTPGPNGYLEVPPGTNVGIRETSARDVVTLWFFTTALRECRDPWAAKLAPEFESNRAKASVTLWNLVSTAVADLFQRTQPSVVDSRVEYLTHQVRERVGPWSNKRRRLPRGDSCSLPLPAPAEQAGCGETANRHQKNVPFVMRLTLNHDTCD